MVQQKTVLILGAGASHPYGFPLGLELSQLIYSKAKSISPEDAWGLYNIKKNNIISFSESFKKSGVSSIDEFLFTRPEFIEIGKSLIANVLLPFEDESKLFDIFGSEVKENWYRSYLIQSLISSNKLSGFSSNQLSIITFNYDSSLEHFLFTSLKNRFNESDENIAVELNQLKIIHVHGQLGFLPWQKHNVIDSVIEYGGKSYKYSFLSAAKHIKIIHEANPASEEFKIATELIEDANSVYFLGFGFHPENLRRLQLKVYKNKRVAGTGVNLGKMGIHKAVHDSKSFISESKLLPVSIMDFFKEHHRLQ